MNNVLRPHVTILYQRGNLLHSILAMPDSVDMWRFQPLPTQPGDQFEVLRQDAESQGAAVYASENGVSLGLGDPVLICYRIPLWHAKHAVTRLDRAIIASTSRKTEVESVRRVRR